MLEGIDRRNDAGTVLVEVPAPIDRLLSGEQFLELKVGNGSASDSRVSDLTAGKPTPKLTGRIADVHGRQLPTLSRHLLCGPRRR